MTTWRSLHGSTLRAGADGVNDMVPTDSAISTGAGETCRLEPQVRLSPDGTGGCPGRAPRPAGRRLAPAHGAGEDVLALGRGLPGHLGVELVPDGGRPEVLDQDRGDDARMLVVVGRGGDRCAGDGVEDGAVHGAVRVGVLLVGGQGGHGVARATARHLDAEERGELVRLGPAHRAALRRRGRWRAGDPAWAPPWPASACG